MGVAYDGISSGSALFVRWKQTLRTEVHHFVEILTSRSLRRKIDYSVLVLVCIRPTIKNRKGLRLELLKIVV